MRDECDLAVIGSGPSGLLCALAAARDGLCVELYGTRGGLGEEPWHGAVFGLGLRALAAVLPEALEGAEELATARIGRAGELGLDHSLQPRGLSLNGTDLRAVLEAAVDDAPNLHWREEQVLPVPTSDGLLLEGRHHYSHASAVAIAAWLEPGQLASLSPRPDPGPVCVEGSFRVHEGVRAIEVWDAPGMRVSVALVSEQRMRVRALLSRPAPGGLEACELMRAALEPQPALSLLLSQPVQAPRARGLGLARPRRIARRRAFAIGPAAEPRAARGPAGMSLAFAGALRAARAARELRAAKDAGQVERRFLRQAANERRALLSALTPDGRAFGDGLAPLFARLADGVIGAALGSWGRGRPMERRAG